MRIACLYVPDLLLASLRRAEPECIGQPVVVTDGDGPRARVLAVSDAAARYGVAPGMNAAQARAVESGLVLRTMSPESQRATQAALCDVGDSASPRVEDAGDGVVYLDADGLGALYPNESVLANALAQRALAVGIEARVGLASTKVAAYLAARDGGGVSVIPPGEEWQYLAPLPVSLLQPSPGLAATLRRWGMRTIGDLVSLTASAVGTRLGPEGVALVHRARGEDPHPLVSRPAPMSFQEEAELDFGIEALEPCAFVVRGLLERLTARLQLRGLVCGDLELSLALVTHGREQHTVAVAAPSNDVKALLALVRLHLESQPPAAAVEGIRVRAVSERLRASQLDLFRPAGPAPEKLAVTLARLTALCGADRVGSPTVLDSHRPDAYGISDFRMRNADCGMRIAECGPKNRRSEIGDRRSGIRVRDSESAPIGVHRRLHGEWDEAEKNPHSAFHIPHSRIQSSTFRLAIRAFRPPRPVEIFRDRGRLDFIRGEGLSGRVVMIAGPWRVQAEWWSEQTMARDYYDVQLSDGGVYRLYRDGESRQWFADGVYD